MSVFAYLAWLFSSIFNPSADASQWLFFPSQSSALTPSHKLVFDGANEGLGCGNLAVANFDYNEAFSLAYRVKINSATNAELMVKLSSGSVGWDSYVSSAGAWRAFLGKNGTNYIRTQKDTALTTATWYTLMVTYDGSVDVSGLKIYKDGVVLTPDSTTNTLTAGTTTNTDALQMAQSSGTKLNGEQYWYTIWSSELTAAEALAFHNSGTPLDPRFNSGNYVSSANAVFFVPVTGTDDPVTASGIDDIIGGAFCSGSNMESGDLQAL